VAVIVATRGRLGLAPIGTGEPRPTTATHTPAAPGIA
jgi:hypothetical protein